jgi:pimeloyl-ACP methyl ester carboxylesterase
MGIKTFSFILVACLVVSFPVLANDELIETKQFFNVVVDGHRVRLEGMTVKRADASGRLPVALITHGKPSTTGTMLEEHASGMLPQARDLAYRGWLSVIVIRRGFGASDGPMPAPVFCNSGSLLANFRAAADDLQAVLRLVAKWPDADPTRMIAIGESAGGAAVTALSARNPKGLVGVINVSGGVAFRLVRQGRQSGYGLQGLRREKPCSKPLDLRPERFPIRARAGRPHARGVPRRRG